MSLPDIHEQVLALPAGQIAGLARQALDAPSARLGDWRLEALDHQAVIETTGGIYRLHGDAWDGAQRRRWSVILKVIRSPAENACTRPEELCYWRRELLAYSSGLLARLPNGIRAPRCFGTRETSTGGLPLAWLWLETVGGEDIERWDLQRFERAARALGQFGAAYLGGAAVPAEPWLCDEMLAQKMDSGEWWARYTNPASPKNAWQHLPVQALFPPQQQERVLRLWAEKERLLAAHRALPRVLCHNDAHRANFALPARSDAPPVLLDWGFCGPGALGSDLGQLIGTSLSGYTSDPAEALALETAVLRQYTAALREAGWQGSEREVWLGYAISIALYWGATLPCAVAQDDMAGVDTPERRAAWALLRDVALERGEQALAQIRG